MHRWGRDPPTALRADNYFYVTVGEEILRKGSSRVRVLAGPYVNREGISCHLSAKSSGAQLPTMFKDSSIITKI